MEPKQLEWKREEEVRAQLTQRKSSSSSKEVLVVP